MNGFYGCRQCECTPKDKVCSCLCHDLNGDDDL